jgi:hypothetical protein
MGMEKSYYVSLLFLILFYRLLYIYVIISYLAKSKSKIK